jgi:hypothetical protein
MIHGKLAFAVAGAPGHHMEITMYKNQTITQ